MYCNTYFRIQKGQNLDRASAQGMAHSILLESHYEAKY